METWRETWRAIWREFWPDEKSSDDKPVETPKYGYWGIRVCQVLVLVVLLLVGSCLGFGVDLLKEIPEATRLKIGAVLAGLEITLFLGLFSGWLLETHVWVRYPDEWKALNYEREGGGAFLGFLERLIFFAAFWHSALLGGAWLAFKLGAKWGVWQHVIRYPETTSLGGMQTMEQIGSRILGRFLNGTLWNLACGLIGGTVTTMLWSHLELSPPETANLLLKILDAVKEMTMKLPR